MKKSIKLLVLTVSLLCKVNAQETFEISNSEVRAIFATQTYEFRDKGLYSLPEAVPYLQDQFTSWSDIKGKITFDNNTPYAITLQCFTPTFTTHYIPITLEEAYSYSEESAKKHICYKYDGNEGYSGGYYFKETHPIVDSDEQPIFEEIGLPFLLFNNTIQVTPMENLDWNIPVIRPEGIGIFEAVPKIRLVNIHPEILIGISQLAAEGNGFQKNLLNLGLVCKDFYKIYLSQYVVGKDPGVTNPLQVINSMSSLLNGTPVDFKASNGAIGSFNFASDYGSIEVSLTPSGGTICGVGNKCGYDIGEKVSISVLSGNLLAETTNAWPFGSVSKITFNEYTSGTMSAQEMYPGDAEKWNDPQYHSGADGSATYTLEGEDREGKPLNISFSFYKPAV